MADDKGLRVSVTLGSEGVGAAAKLVRFSYLTAFQPRMNKESGKLEYSVAVLIPKTNQKDVEAVKSAIDELIKDEWTNKRKPLPPKFWNPLRDGDKDTKQDGRPLGEECRGHYVINVKAGATDAEGNPKAPPRVVGTQRNAQGKLLDLGPRDVKSGDFGRISMNLGAYTKGTGGVGAYIVNIQKVREGDPLSGGRSAEDDFGSFDDDDGFDDPMLN